jgi:hypothetical protein
VDSSSAVAMKLKSVNAIYLREGKIVGDLTDYSGAKQILQREVRRLKPKVVSILGDGAMATMSQLILQELGVEYKIFSRKIGWSGVFEQAGFFINSCLREAVFPKFPPAGSFVWDFNYNYRSVFDRPEIEYQDGKELLALQAQYFLTLLGCTFSKVY